MSDERRREQDSQGRARPLCEALTKRGTRCRAVALPDSPFCLTHDPSGNGLSPKVNAVRRWGAERARDENDS